ncbi:TIGR02450 family Trp-rich protein [Massilia sp. TSP1-1-2]|uniref:TIGR02450 family Trp-rich protein n=1 Tax=unclassified Massilia TaxID=2609279 RepID=UPI003CE90BB7
MNILSPKKLLRTKWTAVIPDNKEKHFIVTAVVQADQPDQTPEWIDLEAVHSGVTRRIGWRELRDASLWRQGWT